MTAIPEVAAGMLAIFAVSVSAKEITCPRSHVKARVAIHGENTVGIPGHSAARKAR